MNVLHDRVCCLLCYDIIIYLIMFLCNFDLSEIFMCNQIARPPEIQITLFPLESMGGAKAHVSVDLLVKCSSSYPDV